MFKKTGSTGTTSANSLGYIRDEVILIANRTSLSTYQYHEDLWKILKYLLKLLEAKNTEELDHALLAFPNSLYALLQKLFCEYRKPESHMKPGSFLRSGLGKIIDFENDFLKDLVKENLEPHFVQLFPFLSLLRELHIIRVTPLSAEMLSHRLQIVAHQISQYLHSYEVVLPIQQMIDFAKLGVQAYQSADFERLKTILSMLGETVKKWIPYVKRDKNSGESYYKEVGWRTIEAIADFVYNPAYADFLRNNCLNIEQDLQVFVDELQQLKRYEESKYNQNACEPPKHSPFKVLQNLECYYSDIENLTYMRDCIRTLLDKPHDSYVFRLSALRLLTILGEGMKNVSSYLVSCHSLFSQFKVIRNQIIHPRGRTAKAYINLLLRDSENTTLVRLMNDCQSLTALLKQLLNWRRANPILLVGSAPTSTLKFPVLSEVCVELTTELKLTLEERAQLLSTLPAADSKKTTEKRRQLKGLLIGKAILPRNFDEFYLLFNSYGISKKLLKDCFVKLKRLEILRRTRDEVKRRIIDSSEGKERLNRIISESVKKENVEAWSIKLNQVANVDELVLLVEDFINYIKIPLHVIENVIFKIPKEEIDLRPIKLRLENCIKQQGAFPSERDFVNDLNVLDINENEARTGWLVAFSRLCGDVSLLRKVQRPETVFKRARQLIDKITKEIKEINVIMKLFLYDSDIKSAFRRFSSDKVLIFACEFLLGKFLHEVRNLVELLDQVKDFSDIRSRSLFLCHPVDAMVTQLKNYLNYRNRIFHLDNLYAYSHESEVLRHLRIYDYLEYLILGTMYPEAIIIDSDSVARAPIRDKSLIDRLEQCKDVITIYENKLIEKQQQSYWQNLGSKSLLPMFIAENALWSRYESERKRQEYAPISSSQFQANLK